MEQVQRKSINKKQNGFKQSYKEKIIHLPKAFYAIDKS